MIRRGAVRLFATLAATGTSAVPAFSGAAAQAIAEREGRLLGAAVEEVRSSPFHARSAASSTEALGLHALPGYPIASVGRPAALAGAPASDTTVEPANLSKVFLASWGAAAVSHYLGLISLYGGPPAMAIGAGAVIALPALGAKLAGAPTGAAFGGSVPGLLVGIGAGAAAAAAAGGMGVGGFYAFLAASSLAHAGVITLYTLWAEHGYR